MVQDDVDESIALVPPTGQVNTIPPTLSQKPLAEMMVPSQLSPPSKGDHHSEVAKATATPAAPATTTVATTRPTTPGACRKVGWVLLAIVLYAPRGLVGLMARLVGSRGGRS